MMVEQNYIDVAQKRANEDVMTKHWQYLIDNEVWVSSKGVVTPVKELDNSHIEFIINGLLDFTHPLCKDVIRMFVRTLIDRARKKQ